MEQNGTRTTEDATAERMIDSASRGPRTPRPTEADIASVWGILKLDCTTDELMAELRGRP